MILVFLLVLGLLSGCVSQPAETTAPVQTEAQIQVTEPSQPQIAGDAVEIRMNGQDITVSGNGSGVYTSRDIIYYENRETYPSGNPYGEGEDWEKHTREEAMEHLVINITAPGNYRISGKLDKGQIRIDLGEDAEEDPSAVVNLILDGAEITCTVAPAILFRNVYECDSGRTKKNAAPDVDTAAAGANLILAENSENIVRGSHVAKIYKDKEDEKKLYKQDGAIYSYMSMNVYGPGALELEADNEGMDTELHLTIRGGDITIRSGNDGINTNEDGVSVTAIHGGSLRILAGLGAEGDGIDSNGYLVIYGGTVISSAHPAADAGLDSDLGSYIHGGTVITLGSAMDWAESDSAQVTMNLQFARMQTGDIRITREDGSTVFEFDPAQDPVLAEMSRGYQGAILSCPEFRVGDSYHVFASGKQMAYTGTDVMQHPGGMAPPEGGFEGGQRPGPGFPGVPGGQTPPGDMPEPPEGEFTLPPQPPEGDPAVPQGGQEGGPGGPQGGPGGQVGGPQGGPGGYTGEEGEKQTLFHMQDKVNFFSGLTEAEE